MDFQTPLKKVVQGLRGTMARLQFILNTASKVGHFFGDIIGGLRSQDHPTRVMSGLFFLGVFGLIYVGITSFPGSKNSMLNADGHGAGRNLASSEKEKESEEDANQVNAKKRLTALEIEESGVDGTKIQLSTFTWELKDLPGATKNPDVMNMAEVEITLFCDTPETREYIRGNIPQVRNQVTNALIAIDREELLSNEGKKKVKNDLMKRVNQWLPKGKIRSVYFTRLVIN